MVIDVISLLGLDGSFRTTVVRVVHCGVPGVPSGRVFSARNDKSLIDFNLMNLLSIHIVVKTERESRPMLLSHIHNILEVSNHFFY